MSTKTFNKHISIAPTVTPVICVTALLFSGLVNAGAWTGPKGASYNKFGFNYFSSDKVFDGDNNSVDAGSTFTDLNFTYYGEYGIEDYLSVFGSIPFKSVESDPDVGPSVDNSGIGDIDVGLRYNVYNDKKWGLISIQGLVKIPEAYDEKDELTLGNGQYDVEGRILYGKSLYPQPVYFGLEVGYRYRADEPSDEFKYLIEVGYTATDKLSLRAKLDGTTSAKNADKGAVGTVDNPTLAPDFDIGKLELTAGFTIKKDTFIEVTYSPTLYGRTTADGTTISLALIFAL